MPTITITVEVYHVHPSHLNQLLEVLSELDSPDAGLLRVVVERPRIQASAPYATRIDVENQIEIGLPINDSAALTIASWYASARGAGQTFNELATGRAVPVDELLDAISAVEAAPSVQLIQADALKALARWVELSTTEN